MDGERDFALTSTLNSRSTSHPRAPIGPWLIAAAGCLLVALPWLWPALYGPINDMWPNLVAWASAGILLVVLPCTRERAELAIASGWLLAAVTSAVMGLLQFFDMENGLSPWVVVTWPGHVLANVHQVNLLATLLGVGLLSLWWMTLSRHLKPLLASTIACFLIVGLAATASRTGLLHAILLSGLLLYWGRLNQRSWVVVLLGLALYVVATLSLPWLQQTLGIASGRDLVSRFAETSACSSRRVIWSNVFQLISMKPWTGWGWDGLAYAHYITPFDGLRFCEKLSNAHNLPLQLAVSVGLPIAAMVASLFVFVVFKLKPWSTQSTSEQLAWGVLLLLGFHSLVEYPLWFGVPQGMAACAVWLVWRSRHPKLADATAMPTAAMSLPGRGAVAALMLVGLMYVAWDYFRVTQLFTPSIDRHQNYRSDTLNKVRKTWLFQSYVLYAVVNTTTVDTNNAGMVLNAALEVLKEFPDPEIIIKVIDAARMTGDTMLAELHAERFKAAWPKAFAAWVAR